MSRASKGGFRPRFFVNGDDPGGGRLAPPSLAAVVANVAERPAARGAHCSPEPQVLAPESAGFEVQLGPDDSHHALAVLRLHLGDECEVVLAPSRAVYRGEVAVVGKTVRVRLSALLQGDEAGARYRREVWLVQALARPAAMDYVIEKGTETGASRFLLLPGAGSPKLRADTMAGRIARWQKVAREAAKQSKQVAVPKIEFAGSLEAALAEVEGRAASSIVLEPRARRLLDELVREVAERTTSGVDAAGGESGPVVAVWVGPESGWSEREVERFRVAGVNSARLGSSVLRTETAGPVAVAVVRLGLKDW